MQAGYQSGRQAKGNQAEDRQAVRNMTIKIYETQHSRFFALRIITVSIAISFQHIL
jgi:hypothetical protein